MEDHNPNKIPIEVNLKLLKDDESEVVNELIYFQLVKGLIYLTTTRPDKFCSWNVNKVINLLHVNTLECRK
jgi:hypothetical protein